MRTSRAKLATWIGWCITIASLTLLAWTLVMVPGFGWPEVSGEESSTKPLGINVPPQWRESPIAGGLRILKAGEKIGRWELTYRYEVAGKTYIGRHTTSDPWYGRLAVRYNPEDPSQSVLATGANPVAIMVSLGTAFLGFVIAKVSSAGVAPRAK